MKALCFHEHGGPDVLVRDTVSNPKPAAGEVLLRVKACAINHLDVWVRRGWPGLDLKKPHWGGSDIAGEIVELGAGIEDWKVGQRVVVYPGVNRFEDEYTRNGEPSMSPGYRILGEHMPGGFAEYAAVPAGNLVAMPDDLDFPTAAAPLLVTLTAWRMLIHRAKLRAGESVLVVGAGGGVNSMAIQIAKLAGATVYAVASNAEKGAAAARIGADAILDRSRVDWGRELFKMTGKRGVDVIVDNVGAATINTSMKALARGGRIVIVGNTSGPMVEIDLRYIFSKQISLIGSTMGSRQDFGEILPMLWSGRLKTMVDRVMPLSEGREAFERLERGDAFGKIVLAP